MFEEYAQDLAYLVYNDINKISTAAWYNPPSGKQFMQDMNYNPLIPSQSDLTAWLKDPGNNEENLRGVSQYIESAIMQYKRTLNHFSQILTFNNQLISIDSPDANKPKQVAAWKSGYLRCLEYLRKFNLRYQKNLIMEKMMSEGGYFAYVSETKDFVTLVEIPSNWCYITGRTDIGWTYGINLAYFDRYVGMEYVMPELYEYYREFVKMRDIYNNNKSIDLNKYQFYPVPFDKGYVFCFDMLRAEMTPPFKGVFKDAVSIIDYKNLLKQKATLDTWKLIAQIIPRNDKNEPALDAKYAQAIIQLTQQGMPAGVKTFATPMDVQELNFNNAQNMNNIIGMGETMYWKSVGVNGVIMDGAEKTVEAVRASLKNDVGFVNPIYTQFENFINLQLLKQSRGYRFRISLFGDRYSDSDEMVKYQGLVTGCNFPVGKLFAFAGYQPYEVDGLLTQESILGLKDKMTPIISAFNTKGMTGTEPKTTGRPESATLSDSSEKTKDYQSNTATKAKVTKATTKGGAK